MNLKFNIVCGLSIFVLVYIFYHIVPLALLSLLLLKPLEKINIKYLEKKRKEALQFQFKDLLYSISSSVSVGRQMPEALREGLENMKLIYKETSPIVEELSYAVKGLFTVRESEEKVLNDFAKRCELEDVYNFVDAYLTCRTTGGDVERMVMKSADLIMEKIAIKKEIHTLTAQKKFEANILLTMPIFMLIFLQIVSPDYLTVMYTTFIGRILMTLSLGGLGLSYYLSAKITNIRI